MSPLDRFRHAGVLVLLAGWMSFLAPMEAARAQGGELPEQEVPPRSERSAVDEEDDEPLTDLSPTGYIDDAVVASRFRVQYSSAFDSTKPDRAEFIYGKCLCFNAAFGQDAASPGPAKDLDFQELELAYERVFSRRLSLFVEVPFRSVELEFGAPLADTPPLDTSGLGDVRAGMKYALIAEQHRHLTFQVRGYFASGDAERALGTDHASIEPALLYLGRPSRRTRLASEFRWWHPLSGSSDPISGSTGRVEIPGLELVRGEPRGGASPDPPDPRVRNNNYAGDILRFGVGVSYEVQRSRVSVSPVAEVVGWYVLDGYAFTGEVLEADNDTIVNLKLGARVSGRLPGSVYLGYGFPLTGEEWYGGIFRLEYRVGLPVARRAHDRPIAASEFEDRVAAEVASALRAAEAARVAAEIAAREAQARREQAEAEATAREEAARQATQKAEREAAAEESEAPARVEPTIATRETEVLAAAHRWSQAWSAQRVDVYLALYSYRFRPSSGMSLQAWQAQRRARLSAPSFIEVSLDGIRVATEGSGRATVEFTQRYVSNIYSDTVRKRLLMVLEEDGWRILREELLN